MSGPDEYAELIEELRVVKQQNEHYRIQLGAAREMNAALASKLGQMEQQRNHARWKYGRAKRKWREHREALENQIAHRNEIITGHIDSVVAEHIRQHEAQGVK
jgi:hypothetical protein